MALFIKHETSVYVSGNQNHNNNLFEWSGGKCERNRSIGTVSIPQNFVKSISI